MLQLVTCRSEFHWLLNSPEHSCPKYGIRMIPEIQITTARSDPEFPSVHVNSSTTVDICRSDHPSAIKCEQGYNLRIIDWDLHYPLNWTTMKVTLATGSNAVQCTVWTIYLALQIYTEENKNQYRDAFCCLK